MEKQFCPYCMNPVTPGEPCGVCGLTEGSYTPSPHHLPLGTVLRERYLVGRVLGEGGFGITYIGCDLRLELKVAIKEYFPTDRANRVSAADLSVSSYTGAAGDRYEAGKERFLQEARTMAKMAKMPVIVSVRDFFEINNTAYIVMEYVEGTTFKDLVAHRGGRLPAGELMHMIEPLFFALKAMHGLGLIHRDISPENLMLEHGEVRLLDFGCARESGDGGATLTIALKHGYAPVEQYQSKGQGPWTDVYALAATIYYCLTGRKPPQAMDRLVEDELIPPRQLGVDLTARQETALLRGMGTLPKRRFQSMEEFHTALYTGEFIAAAEEPAKQKETAPERTEVPAEQKEIPAEQQSDTAEQTPAADASEEKPAETVTEKKSVDWKELLHKYWPMAAGAAAVLVLIVALAAWKPWAGGSVGEPGDPSAAVGSQTGVTPNGEQTPGTPQAITDEESIALFANAVHMEESSEEQFRELLADPAVEAIYLENGVHINLNDGELVINKPVRIGRHGGLGFIWPVTIGEGGHLRVIGNADVVGLLRTVEGGSVLVGQGGQVSDSGMVWLERETDLVIAGGEMNIPQNRVLVFCEEEVFAKAVHVTSFMEYENARRGAYPIVIDANITLVGQGNRNHTVPILISEGVTVTAPVVDDPDDPSNPISYDAWDTDGAVLVNRGTLRGRNVLGVWDWTDPRSKAPVLLNYGTFHADIYNDKGTCGDRAIVVNMGTMSVPHGDLTQGYFANLGTFLHGNLAPEGEEVVDVTGDFYAHYYLNLNDIGAYNSGVIRLQGAGEDYQSGICTLSLDLRSFFNNVGSIEAGEYAELNNGSWLRNFGEIRAVQGGGISNTGLIDNRSPRSVLDGKNGCYSVGIIQAGQLASVSLSEGTFRHGGAMMNFAWGAGDPDNTAYVSDADELLEALADSSVEMVVVTRYVNEAAEHMPVDITLDEPLFVTKGLAIAGDCNLTVPGLTVSGKNAFIYSDSVIELMGKKLQLESGAVGVMPVPGYCFGITVRNQANLMLTGGSNLIPWAEISVTENAYLTSLQTLHLDRIQVTLNNGILRSCGGMEMTGCTVDVGRASNFAELLINSGSLQTDGDTVINIYGRGNMDIGGNNVDLGGTIVNKGILGIRDDVIIRNSGRIENNGGMHVGGGYGNQIRVSGTVENNGEITFDPGVTFWVASAGSVSGVPAEYLEHEYNAQTGEKPGGY